MVIITSLIVVLSLLFGGTGAAVVAAQGSLPGEGLYTLKLATEDVQFMITGNAEERLGKALDFVNNRFIEATIKEMEGEVWTDQELTDLTERIEQNLKDALMAATAMENPEIGLTTIKDQIKGFLNGRQIQPRDRDGYEGSEKGAGTEMFQNQLRKMFNIVEDGLEDPQNFADTIRVRYGKNLESLDLLTTALDGDILLLEPVDGDVTRDQSINSDQGQSFGSQDPQAQNGEINDPFYAELPGGADRAPSKTLNQSTDDYGSSPGVSGGHNNTSQYKDSNGTQSQDSGSRSEISP